MGRSFGTPPADDGQRFTPFEKLDHTFLAGREGGRLIHKAQRRDAEGRVVTETSAEIRYVLGSRARGRSYLIERDGHLFQSPISWYAQSSSWDLSPGFETFYPPEPFVEATCLFCHVNRARPVEHTRNQFQPPIFEGTAIGCERCHGPGALHADSRRRGEAPAEGPDLTIVNPGGLPPALREAVCQQCHLQGEKRVLRRGRQPFDYRPGLPLHLFWAVFVRSPEFADHTKAVGHVEQMRESACFRKSDGKMGCVSCHDPHRVPETGRRAEYYRRRCLDCHERQECALPEGERRRQSAADSCVDCHMPRYATSNIAHTAVTDHRVPRRPGAAEARRPPRTGGLPVMNFRQDELVPEDADAARDLGVALVQLARQPGPLRERLPPVAAPLLEAAVRSAPGDVLAWEARAEALALLGRGARRRRRSIRHTARRSACS